MNEHRPQQPPPANRLAREQSPYLRMHAHNPVDWYAWGEEAFEKARREDKPIFLSIGYYTCHWCHVMERESFANPAIAEVLNRDFVSIKVDREERPDVDRLYMSFVQATSGGGGWPLSAFLTPDRKPFLGGTYFPPDDRFGRPGFATVLRSIAHTWREERERVVGSADQLATALTQYLNPKPASAGRLDQRVLDGLQRQLRAAFDEHNGGFGDAPKFPRPVTFTFLLQDFARTGRRESLDMTLASLRAMARGGMYDHLGGGFHRYSTDARWHVPHFEKMLYDQAQLVPAYLAGWQLSGEPLFARVARETLDYVLRDMTSAAGGFYSAEDADSAVAAGSEEHAEGAFYVWTRSEIEAALPPAEAAAFCRHYGVEADGNVAAQQDPHGELRGRNVVDEVESLEQTAAALNVPLEQADGRLASARRTLFELRRQRPHPPTDDKVLTAWNGLMIGAFARAARVLAEPRYLAAAQTAARFVESTLLDAASGRLRRRWRDGDVAIDGFVDDYAFLIAGLIELYQADFDARWLQWADRLQQRQNELFWAPEAGGYYATTGEDASLFLRLREDYDGAEPSPNSVSVFNLLHLAEMTGNDSYRERGGQVLAALGERLEKMPESLPLLAAGLDLYLTPPRQVVIAGDADAADTKALLRVTSSTWLPYHFVLLLDGGEGQRTLSEWRPELAAYGRQEGAAAAYVCENFTCQLPVTDAEALARLLRG